MSDVTLSTSEIQALATQMRALAAPDTISRGLILSLLATLPKCCGCEHPATRTVYSEELPEWPPGSRMVSFTYTFPPPPGTWHRFAHNRHEADCCDEHEPVGASESHPLPHAPLVREAQAALHLADVIDKHLGRYL